MKKHGRPFFWRYVSRCRKPIPNGHSVGKQMRPCLQSWPQSHSRLWLFGFWIFASGSARGWGGRGLKFGWLDWLDSLPAVGEKRIPQDSWNILMIIMEGQRLELPKKLVWPLWFPCCSWWSQHSLKPIYEKLRAVFFKRVPSIKTYWLFKHFSKNPYVQTYVLKNEAATYRVCHVRFYSTAQETSEKIHYQSLDQNIQPCLCQN